MVSASLLALFVGQASKVRMTIGAVGFAGYFLIAGLGLVALSGGTSLFGGMIARMSGDYAKEPVHDLHGLKADWKLTAPGDEWRLRSDASAKKDNPIVDRWISRPDLDAHVLIIAEQVPGKTIPIEAYTDAILQSGAKAGTDFKILERKKLEGRTDARFVHTTSTIKGLKIEHYYGLFTTGDRAYQVVAFAAQGTFPKVSDELRQIIESFQPAP